MNTMLLTSMPVAPFISFPDQFFKSGLKVVPVSRSENGSARPDAQKAARQPSGHRQ
jgi:hypothetical protein